MPRRPGTRLGRISSEEEAPGPHAREPWVGPEVPPRWLAPASLGPRVCKAGADARFSCLAAKVSENTMRRQILDELGALTHAPLSTFPG